MTESEKLSKGLKLHDPNTDVPGQELPFDRIIPSDLPLIYSDNMVVRSQDGMFFLYFFQNRYPLAFTEEERAGVTKVDSICVAQIVLTPSQTQKGDRSNEY